MAKIDKLLPRVLVEIVITKQKYLNSFERRQEEGRLCGMCDVCINHCPGRDVLHSANALCRIFREEPRIMPFLNNQVGDARLVVGLERLAGALNGADLAHQDILKLAFAHAVSVEHHLFRLPTAFVNSMSA